MLSRWPIRNKLLLGIALLLVIVVTMSISSFQGTYAYRNLVRSLSSRVTELPLATELLRQVGDLRVTLAELQTQAPFSDFSVSPTVQQLSVTFQQQFAMVRQTAKKYREELEEHEVAEFRIGDASREWRKLSEIEQCLERIEELTTEPPAESNPASAKQSYATAIAAASTAKSSDADDRDETENKVAESAEPSSPSDTAEDVPEAPVYLGPRYQPTLPKPRPELWYCDHRCTSRLATEELVELQNFTRELPSYLQGHLHDLAGDVRSRYRAWIVLTWICSVAATVLTVLFILLIYRWVFRPLRMLVKGSRRVAGGDFNYQIELPSRDEMGELAEAMNDMTMRFRTIRNDLDHQVQVRTKQVVRSEQLASVGFLAAGVAHEINNPLASIAMCAESLEGRLLEAVSKNSEQSELVGRYLRMIQTEAFRCKEITEKLLDFSRVGEVKRQSADLRELVQTVIDMVRHLGKYQNRNLEFPPGEPVIALINVQEIKQVVLNLVTNALDSVEADGKLTIALRRKGNFAEMIFTDNGCGMTDEVLEHLFEPFFTRKRVGQGTGLGLSIVYRIVSDHGGQIEATSAGPGCGSQFHVTLPLAEADLKPSPSGRGQGEGARVRTSTLTPTLSQQERGQDSKLPDEKTSTISAEKETNHRYQAA